MNIQTGLILFFILGLITLQGEGSDHSRRKHRHKHKHGKRPGCPDSLILYDAAEKCLTYLMRGGRTPDSTICRAYYLGADCKDLKKFLDMHCSRDPDVTEVHNVCKEKLRSKTNSRKP